MRARYATRPDAGALAATAFSLLFALVMAYCGWYYGVSRIGATQTSVYANLTPVAAMIVVKHLKSNAICLVNDGMLVGAGAGQMDRLASCRIAIDKARDRAQGAIAGSDAFFPFRDGPDTLIAAGVRAIVQPGGSKRDDETIAACNDAGVTLLFTGRRHFRH